MQNPTPNWIITIRGNFLYKFQTCRIPGKFKSIPMTGICRRKFTAAGRNPLETREKYVKPIPFQYPINIPKEEHKSPQFDNNADQSPAN
jgi:hypothetical protein